MIGVADALELVRRHCVPRAARRTRVDEAWGSVLASEIVCNHDSPPHDKTVVDGYAVCCAGVQSPGTTLRIVEEVMAGQLPSQVVSPGTATRIMTGAPIPLGADAVVMVERTELVPTIHGEQVRINESPRAGQNIMRRGDSMRIGDVVLRAGHPLRGIELGLLAELGVTELDVVRRPTVAIISTGNELVPPHQSPGPGQIRNSNTPMLTAMVREAGGQPVPQEIARDTAAELTSAIQLGLHHDVLLLSGGVSAGVLDLVPSVLRDQGVEEIFHKVHLKPGKPLWFGTRSRDGGSGKQLVFGLPGNPVSSLVCFHLFVCPAIRLLAGQSLDDATTVPAQLAQPFRYHSDRPTFLPARARRNESGLLVEPLGWRGSADLRTLVDANVLLCFDPGEHDLPKGGLVAVRWL